MSQNALQLLPLLLLLSRAPNISPPGACTWKIALKYKVQRPKHRVWIPVRIRVRVHYEHIVQAVCALNKRLFFN